MPRILLVDDDVAFRTMLHEILQRAGHEVEEAQDGRAAIRLYDRQRWDLVVTDLVMPEKEGIETIIELRRLDPDVKIIAVSGGGRMNPNANLNVARKLGANRTLAKPFTHREILDAIAQVLGESKAPETPR